MLWCFEKVVPSLIGICVAFRSIDSDEDFHVAYFEMVAQKKMG